MNTNDFHWPTSRAAWAGLIILTVIGVYYASVKDLATASTIFAIALSVLGIGGQASAIQKTQAVAIANQNASLVNQAAMQADLTNIRDNPAMPGTPSDDDFNNFTL